MTQPVPPRPPWQPVRPPDSGDPARNPSRRRWIVGSVVVPIAAALLATPLNIQSLPTGTYVMLPHQRTSGAGAA